jgi:twitching motility protein PilT
MSVATATIHDHLADLLGRHQLWPPELASRLVARAVQLNKWLGQVAIDDNLVSERELTQVLAEETDLPVADLSQAVPDPTALARLRVAVCREHLVVPLGLQGQTLQVAVANPLEPSLQDLLAREVRGPVAMQVAPLKQLLSAVDLWYRDFVAPIATESAPVVEDVEEPPTLAYLLTLMTEKRASDLHLAVGQPPLLRVNGDLAPVPGPILRPQHTQSLLFPILTDRQRAQFDEHQELDLSHSVPGTGRFRVNVFRQRGSVGAVLRAIPTEIPTLDSLSLPPVVKTLTTLPRGLVLVTGPTGSGKSTTLAAMINEINHAQRTHIMTIEDPVEFLHRPVLAEINQREVGSDTESFVAALRHVLRQDPDVILIGEMRDLETIAAAITAAETGHLVFATLHTNSAAQTIDRIIDVFPSGQQAQIRSQLANVLEAILTQVLVQTADGHGRCCAMEILLANMAVRSLIRDAKIYQIPNTIEVSAKQGMQTLDQALKQLVLDKRTTPEQAVAKSSSPEDFQQLLSMG